MKIAAAYAKAGIQTAGLGLRPCELLAPSVLLPGFLRQSLRWVGRGSVVGYDSGILNEIDRLHRHLHWFASQLRMQPHAR